MDLLPKINEEGSLLAAIESHSSSFFPDSERTQAQQRNALLLANQPELSVLSGAAGCGKTKIGLEWAKVLAAKKIYWIVPRVSVGQGIFEELTSKDFLFDCKVELFTGEYKLTRTKGKERVTKEAEHLNGDVVITTIDQLVNGISTHAGVNIFTDFMLSHAIFDEYHEYIPMDAFNLLFCEIISARKQASGHANTLLISATPNYLFTEKMLGVHLDDVIEMGSSNTSRYSIVFEEFNDDTPYDEHPLYRAIPDNTFVISNTATTAQDAFLRNLNEESTS